VLLFTEQCGAAADDNDDSKQGRRERGVRGICPPGNSHAEKIVVLVNTLSEWLLAYMSSASGGEAPDPYQGSASGPRWRTWTVPHFCPPQKQISGYAPDSKFLQTVDPDTAKNRVNSRGWRLYCRNSLPLLLKISKSQNPQKEKAHD